MPSPAHRAGGSETPVEGSLSQLRGMLTSGKTRATHHRTITLLGKTSVIDTFDGVHPDLSGLRFQIASVLGTPDIQRRTSTQEAHGSCCGSAAGTGLLHPGSPLLRTRGTSVVLAGASPAPGRGAVVQESWGALPHV